MKRYYNTSIPPVTGKQLEITYEVMKRHIDNPKVKACYDNFKAVEETLPNGEKMVFINADNNDLGLKYTYITCFYGEEIIKELGKIHKPFIRLNY